MKAVHVIACLLLGACAAEKPAPSPPKMIRAEKPSDAFTVDLPKGCALIDAPRSLDFAVLSIKCDGVDKVGVYVGNFSDATSGDKTLTLKPDIPGREIVVKTEGPDKRTYGYVWKTAYDWPSQLHVWVMPDALDDAQAQAIAASLRPTVPNKTTHKAEAN